VVGSYTDRHPKPYSLVCGMGITLSGLVALALAPSYYAVLVAAGMVGLGSAIFHPESSRMARLASGGNHGFAQSLFQVGGNAGSSIGPLLAAGIITRYGRQHILWFTLLAFAGMFILARVGSWYRKHLDERRTSNTAEVHHHPVAPAQVPLLLGILLCLMFSKFFYLASMTNYYTFYLIQRFGSLPGKVGAIAGLFFGFAFGLAGIASAVLGKLADATSIAYVIKVCSFLPLIGLLTAFLPQLKKEPA